MAKSKKKILLFWNGGTQSAVSLFELKSPEYEICGLLSFFDKSSKKTLSSEIDESLIQAQADSAELSLIKVFSEASTKLLDEPESLLEDLKHINVEHKIDGIAFSDIANSESKKRREEVAEAADLITVFPLWGWKPQLVNQAFNGLGHQAIVHGIQSEKLPPAFLGRAFNASFVDDLPNSANICGERSEFFSFVFDGPFFQKKIPFETGDRYQKGAVSFLTLSLREQQASSQNRPN